ncbi:MAG: 4Fe-4S ferredoxin [Chlorobi bacterium]|nr:4Fe-4S ferredoxin [Chlorobiota bacterium]
MKRELVKINEELCTGCGLCIPACHEGALQIVDGKARLVSDLMCDGLGACLGHCPEGAISIEMTEAGTYNEKVVMENMVSKGESTVIAHLEHLKSHGQDQYADEGMAYLRENMHRLNMDVEKVLHRFQKEGIPLKPAGCPGSQATTFTPAGMVMDKSVEVPSALEQWPVQMHLINPAAPYFRGADLLLAADCVAFAFGDFHRKWLAGKRLIIACPKLDHGQESYRAKLAALIEHAGLNSLTVLTMEVPCCSGLVRMAADIMASAQRKVPLKAVVVSVRGEILAEKTLYKADAS